MEYAVPLKCLEETKFEVPKLNNKKWSRPENFPWYNQMYIDIVVEKGGKFAAVELKYATTLIDPKDQQKLSVFHTELPKDINIVKNKGAQNLTMYNYWKDVRRIEAISHFPDVVGGVALIITNDRAYWSRPHEGSGYLPFSTHEGNAIGSGELNWNENIGGNIRESHPPFLLDGSYPFYWEDTNIPVQTKRKGDIFRYMITTIIK